MGQAPAESYTKRMKHTQAKTHDSKRLLSNKRDSYAIILWSEKTALFGVSPLISQPSLSSSASNPDVLQVGLTSPLELASIL